MKKTIDIRNLIELVKKAKQIPSSHISIEHLLPASGIIDEIDCAGVADEYITQLIVGTLLCENYLKSAQHEQRTLLTQCDHIKSFLSDSRVRTDSVTAFLRDIVTYHFDSPTGKRFVQLFCALDAACTGQNIDRDSFINETCQSGVVNLLKIAIAKKNFSYIDELVPTNTVASANTVVIIDFKDEMIRNAIAFHSWIMADKKVRNCTLFRHYINHVPELLRFLPENSTNTYDTFRTLLKQLHYTGSDAITRRAAINKLLNSMSRYEDSLNDWFEADIWYVDNFPFEDRRRTLGGRIKSFVFSSISDDNKPLVKSYIRHLIENSDNTVITINTSLSYLRLTLSTTIIPIVDWTEADVMSAIEDLQDRYAESTPENRTKNVFRAISFLHAFLEYLSVIGAVNKDVTQYPLSQMQLGRYVVKKTAPSDYVIDQIFAVLPLLTDQKYTLLFLIVYETGARIQSVVSLKLDSLKIEGQFDSNGSFRMSTARLYLPSSKGAKDIIVEISPFLALMLDAYRQDLINITPWFFPGKNKHNPLNSQSARRLLQKEFRRLEIKNPDGTPYVFHPHDFRHRIIKKMEQRHIPIQYIAEVAGHSTPEMTLAYLEIDDAYARGETITYHTVHGDIFNAEDPFRLTESELKAGAAIKRIHQARTMEGLCARSSRLGPCPHDCECIQSQCANFLVTKYDLPNLIALRRDEEALLASAEKTGLLPEIKTHQNKISKIDTIIARLNDHYSRNVVTDHIKESVQKGEKENNGTHIITN